MQISTLFNRIVKPYNPIQAALAGVLASAAYAAEMYLDKAISGSSFDDIQLIESAIRGHESTIPWLGMLIHLANGAALAQIYAGVVRPRLRGPEWVRGLTFGMIFLAAVWPLTPLVDQVHPLIKSGKMPLLAAPVPFLQNVARHIVFGLVLGLCYRPKTKTTTNAVEVVVNDVKVI